MSAHDHHEEENVLRSTCGSVLQQPLNTCRHVEQCSSRLSYFNSNLSRMLQQRQTLGNVVTFLLLQILCLQIICCWTGKVFVLFFLLRRVAGETLAKRLQYSRDSGARLEATPVQNFHKDQSQPLQGRHSAHNSQWISVDFLWRHDEPGLRAILR